MKTWAAVDGALVQWGERLFYPPNRIVKPDPTPRLGTLTRRKAALVRRRIEAVVVRHAPEVVIKVVGGGRGMRAIAAEFNYISRDGSLAVEDDRGDRRLGKDALRDLADQWRCGGCWIPEVSQRREAINITLSMPRGTDPDLVLRAARAFARHELSTNRYVMALHSDQAHPHVHLIVRAQARSGERANFWAEHHRWRHVFATQLRSLGVDAEATSQPIRGENRSTRPLWRRPNGGDQDPQEERTPAKSGESYYRNRVVMMKVWSHIMLALNESPDPADRRLAGQIASFVRDSPFIVEVMGPRSVQQLQPQAERPDRRLSEARTRTRPRHERELTR